MYLFVLLWAVDPAKATVLGESFGANRGVCFAYPNAIALVLNLAFFQQLEFVLSLIHI
jgi:hypothetical protein